MVLDPCYTTTRTSCSFPTLSIHPVLPSASLWQQTRLCIHEYAFLLCPFNLPLSTSNIFSPDFCSHLRLTLQFPLAIRRPSFSQELSDSGHLTFLPLNWYALHLKTSTLFFFASWHLHRSCSFTSSRVHASVSRGSVLSVHSPFPLAPLFFWCFTFGNHHEHSSTPPPNFPSGF